MRTILTPRRIPLVLLLLLTGVAGLFNGIGEYHDAATAGQRLATVTELGYGAVSWGALAGLLAGRAWGKTLTILWGVLLTITGAAAAVAWGGAGPGAGAAAGASVAALVGLAIWLAYRVPGPRSREIPNRDETS